MEISKKSWAYEMAYWFRSIRPDSAPPLNFFTNFFVGTFLRALFWSMVGMICFLFALKLGKSNEDFFVPIKNWPKILGYRIWPISLIGLSFMIWPFVDFNSWKSRDIFIWITLLSWCIYISIVFTSETWEEIGERTKIVFTENGRA